MASSTNGNNPWRSPTTWGVLFCCMVALRFLLFPPPMYYQQPPGGATTTTSTNSVGAAVIDAPVLHHSHPLDIPTGTAVALPSIRVEKQVVDRDFYGGAGDKVHLGGFTDIDLHGVSPASWKWMLQYLGIRSLLDVGCGRGISTSWFALHGVDTQCVEGSHDAVEKSIFAPLGELVEHDFSRGPWWPSRTVDAVWCVEFLEHVGRNYQQNYIPAFRKAAIIFVTHSQWGGWHHVEVHQDDWWITKMQSYGFIYSPHLTKEIKKIAGEENSSKGEKSPTGETYNAQHVWLNMQVFINPAVASLPEHQHLFAEHGCFIQRDKPPKECGTGAGAEKETALPPEYLPLKITEKQDKAWFDLISKNIEKKEEGK